MKSTNLFVLFIFLLVASPALACRFYKGDSKAAVAKACSPPDFTDVISVRASPTQYVTAPGSPVAVPVDGGDTRLKEAWYYFKAGRSGKAVIFVNGKVTGSEDL